MPRTAAPTRRANRSSISVRSTSLRPLLLLVVACLCSLLGTCGVAASAAPSSSSSLFVSSSGLLVDSPLSLQGVDVGSALAQMAKQVAALTEKVAVQDALIASLQTDLTAVESLSGSSAIVSAVQSVTIATDEIGSLTGDSAIVAAVLALRAAVNTVNQSIVVLESTTNAASTQFAAALNSSTTWLQAELAGIAADFSGEIAELQAWNSTAITAITSLTSDVSTLESLGGDSVLVSTITSLSSSLTSLISTVADIADLTGTTTIVTTIQSIIDSMSDQATEIATLQARATADEANITSLQSLTTDHSIQIALLANRTTTLDRQVSLVADSGTFQASGSNINPGAAQYLTQRGAWVQGTIVQPLTITRDGTYAVYGTGRIAGLTSGQDYFWALSLAVTRGGTTTRLTAALGAPSTAGYPAGYVDWADSSRELHWVGQLQVGDVVSLQYLVIGVGTASYELGSNEYGGHRLTTVFLRG